VWTHGLFVANTVLWFFTGSLFCSLFLAMTTAASTMYHRSAEKDEVWGTIDKILAMITLVVTLGWTLPYMSVNEGITAFMLLAVALVCKEGADRGPYVPWHVAWHFLVALGQAFLAFVYWTGPV
jgi:hypothetical protein